MVFSLESVAQVINPGRRAKEKGEQRANDRIDRTIDRGFDKIDEGLGNVFNGKKKNQSKSAEEGSDSRTASSEYPNNSSGSATTTGNDYQSNSKFDFVAGTKVLYSTNFSNEAIGDFPVDFNTNASGEVVNVNGKSGKWLSMTKNGAFIPEAIDVLPENFTMEFEVGIIGDPSNNMGGFGLNFTTVPEDLMKDMFFGQGTSALWIHPAGNVANIGIFPSSGATPVENQINMTQWNISNKSFVKVSIWRQKGRLRVYLGQDKLIDVPRFFAENKPYQLAFFRSFFYDCQILMTNIRLAVAGADTRTKLMNEGRFVTNEILFDVNSDVIRKESQAAIQDIGMVLRDNPSISVKIIGHTDSNGDAAANLALSQKRAVAVKNRLIKDYAIAPSRLTTDGKGASQPISDNNTASGKAQNRRVEFVKQ